MVEPGTQASKFILDVRCLDLRAIPPQRNASRYRVLDASYNKIQVVVRDLLQYNGIVHLNLSVNLLTLFIGRPFQNNAMLRIIDLSHNKLRTFQQDTFEGIVTLTELYLNNNLLSEFDIGILQHFKTFGSLKLDLSSNNNLTCLPLCYIHYFTYRVMIRRGFSQRQELVCTQGEILHAMISSWSMCSYWCRDNAIFNSNIVDTSVSLIAGTLHSRRRCSPCYTQPGILEDTFMVTCDLRHGWWGNHIDCEWVTCPEPPRIDHVEYMGWSDLNCPSWLEFCCEKGYNNMINSLPSMQCSQGEVGNVTGIWRNSWKGGPKCSHHACLHI